MRTGVHSLAKKGNFLFGNEFLQVQQKLLSFPLDSFESRCCLRDIYGNLEKKHACFLRYASYIHYFTEKQSYK